MTATTTSYDIAIKRTLRRHPYWGSTESGPYCACGWELPDGVPTHASYTEWTWHVADQVAQQVTLIVDGGITATATPRDDARHPA